MKLRIGKHIELGITGERNYTDQDLHFALLGVGGEWARKAYAYFSLYFLKWRVEFYIDYQKMEDKWGYEELDAWNDIIKDVDSAFFNIKAKKLERK
jgi:hypothetical protein